LNRTARSALIVALASILAIGVAACSSSSKKSTGSKSGDSEPVSVLAILPLSGTLASSGKTNAAAVKAAIATVNGAGGVNGRMLQLDLQDDGGDGGKAATLLRAAVNSGKVPDILVDGSTSPESLAMQPVVQQNKIFTVASSSGILFTDPDPRHNPTKFTTSPSLPTLGDVMATYLKSKSYKKVAMLSATDSYGQAWKKAYSHSIETAGITITSSQSFDPTALDMTPQLQTLQATHPDAVLAEAYGAPIGYILKDREKLGMISTPMVGANTFSTTDLTKLATTAQLGNLTFSASTISKYVDPAMLTGARKAFYQALQANGGINQAISAYGYEYDAVILAAAALTKSGTGDGLKAAQALESLGSTPNAVMQSKYYDQQNHVPLPDASAYTVLVAGPLTEGMVKS
jgi:branched-chain amino acid transport system substrate-binding protein